MNLYHATDHTTKVFSGGASQVEASFAPLPGAYAVNIDATVSTTSGAVLCHAVAHSARSGHNNSSTNVAFGDTQSESETLGMTGGMFLLPGSTIQVYCEASRGASRSTNLLVFQSLAITATQVSTIVDAPDQGARVRAKPLNSFVKSRAGGSYTATGPTDRSQGARP